MRSEASLASEAMLQRSAAPWKVCTDDPVPASFATIALLTNSPNSIEGVLFYPGVHSPDGLLRTPPLAEDQ
jgi:hypothetical protein